VNRESKLFLSVAALAAIVSLFFVGQVERQRRVRFQAQCSRLVDRLESLPAHSRALGALAALGSAQPDLLRMAQGRSAHPGADAGLLRGLARDLGAADLLVLDRNGTVRAHAGDAGASLPPLGFQRALQGSGGLYAALGPGPGERGMFAAVPVRDGTGPGAAVAGVLAARLDFEPVDELLRGEPGRLALVNPDGVVFAATDSSWLLRKAAGAERAGAAPAAGNPGALPQSTVVLPQSTVVLPQSTVVLPVDLGDPGGSWRLLGLVGPDRLASLADGMLLGALVLLAGLAGGAVWLEHRRRAELAQAILVREKESAERAAQARAELVANLSHEIRTPVGTITSLAHLSLAAGAEPGGREVFGKILAASRHLMEILDRILDFAKLEAGRMELERAPFRPAELLDRVRDLLADRAAAKGLTLALVQDSGLPAVLLGDALALSRVLVNFTSNAIKFTERGEVRVEAALEQRAGMRVRLRLAVRDAGPGLSEEERRGLFQPFRQADRAVARTHGGTGLGLALCKELARLMDGEVGVDSEPGRGCTFWLRVELEQVADSHAAAPAAPATAPSGPARILLAEDHEANRSLACTLLREAGFTVDSAADGAEAVRLAQASRYDVVLMDVRMPVLDGLAATEAIRRIPGRERTPILALTAGALPGDRERCRNAGMDGFLAKPFDPAVLGAEIRRWLAPGMEPAAAPPGRPLPERLPALEPPPWDIPGVDVRKGLKLVLGRRDLYLGLLQAFARGQRDTPARIRAALAAGDLAAAERQAHTLKGLLASLGAGALQAWAANLEQALRQGRPMAAVEALADGLEVRCADLVRQLDRALSAETAQAAPEADPARSQETVLVVDDSPENRELLAGLLVRRYQVRLAQDGAEALRKAQEPPVPDLVLLDLVMPGMDGFQVLAQLKERPLTRDVPVIFLTASDGPEAEWRGLELGAADFLAKPVSAPILLSRVANHIKLKGMRDLLRGQNSYLETEVARRTREVLLIQDVTIQAMAALAETRDAETGAHIRRTQHFVRILARKLQERPRYRDALRDEVVDLLYRSAPLHDIGKVGIPDRILLKPGRLTAEEYAVMKRHAVLGRDAIVAAERQLGTPVPFLALAKEIALNHHERWDGTGYPSGLQRESIPLSARLMAVADVYDALISRRVYKPAMPHEAALEAMELGRGSHFDPDVLDAMLEMAGQFKEVAERYREPERTDALQSG